MGVCQEYELRYFLKISCVFGQDKVWTANIHFKLQFTEELNHQKILHNDASHTTALTGQISMSKTTLVQNEVIFDRGYSFHQCYQNSSTDCQQRRKHRYSVSIAPKEAPCKSNRIMWLYKYTLIKWKCRKEVWGTKMEHRGSTASQPQNYDLSANMAMYKTYMKHRSLYKSIFP